MVGVSWCAAGSGGLWDLLIFGLSLAFGLMRAVEQRSGRTQHGKETINQTPPEPGVGHRGRRDGLVGDGPRSTSPNTHIHRRQSSTSLDDHDPIKHAILRLVLKWDDSLFLVVEIVSERCRGGGGRINQIGDGSTEINSQKG